MPATAADIAAASRAAAIVVWIDPDLGQRYPSARDGSVSPSTGYFDLQADAEEVISARGELIGTERRRFAVAVAEILSVEIATGLPTVRLIDAEQAADGNMLVSRLELDLETESTSFELFG